MYSILVLTFLFLFQTQALPCGGCSKSKSANMTQNIQSTLGSPSNTLSGTRIIAGAASTKPFKNEKIFESVGKDQGDEDPNWKSSITE